MSTYFEGERLVPPSQFPFYGLLGHARLKGWRWWCVFKPGVYPVFVVRGVPFDEVILAKRCLSVARVPQGPESPLLSVGTDPGGLDVTAFWH